MPIKSGCYFIINVQQKNLAFLPNPNSAEPLQSRYQQNNSGEQWNVIDRNNGHHTIVNVGHEQYASSGTRAAAGEQVVGWERDQTWLIQKTNVKGQYTISTTDSKRFWGIPDCEEGTPIALADIYTDKRNWWQFKDVQTGKDAELNPDLDNGRTANDTTGDMSIQAVLFELVIPPLSLSKPLELDLLIIQEMPNEFILNPIVTANKICRPLVKSGQLDPSNLYINVIELKSFKNNTLQRVSGVQTFDDLRYYQGWNFPWARCPEPAMLSSLTTGTKWFRSSATKVAVLNLRYIPVRGGRDFISQVIRKMADDGIIVILTLSEPHLPDTLFDMELFQELARSSSSILSLPAHGGGFYSCIIDYLQDFDTDTVQTKFPGVTSINPEIPLTRRKLLDDIFDGALSGPRTLPGTDKPRQPSHLLEPIVQEASSPAQMSRPQLRHAGSVLGKNVAS